MNRDEILQKNRQEHAGKADEREVQILANASKVGMAVGGVFCVLMVFFSRITDTPLLGLSAWTIYFSMFGSYRFYHFLKTREKIRLIQAIIGIVFAAACLIGLVVLGLRK